MGLNALATNDLLDTVSAIASVLALLVSMWILINVRRITAFYVKKARLPILHEDLNQLASKLSEQMNESERSDESVLSLLVDVEAKLEALARRLSRRMRRSAKLVAKKIREFHDGDKSHEQLMQVYIQLRKLTTEVGEYRKDLHWER